MGVYVSKHLSFGCIRKAVWGNAMVTNPALAGEIRPFGKERGACGLRLVEKRELWKN